ncbi:MAG: hypothetical protein PHX50_02780 [Massilibacteroides sp.]|nr:hypothetical protein [Massilibacteroides sp.]
MKKSLSILFVLFCMVGDLYADPPEYLFSEFKPARLVSKNLNLFKADVNYSFLLNKFLFKDVSDNNQIKEIDPSMGIRTIKVENRTFLINEKGVTKEVLQQEPLITVQYKGKKKAEGKDAGYGGKSKTSATDAYAYINTGGKMHKLSTAGYVFMGVDLLYEIDRENKTKTFMFASKFIKLYPQNLREQLKEYIKNQNIEFEHPEQVVNLYNYAESFVKEQK